MLSSQPCLLETTMQGVVLRPVCHNDSTSPVLAWTAKATAAKARKAEQRHPRQTSGCQFQEKGHFVSSRLGFCTCGAVWPAMLSNSDLLRWVSSYRGWQLRMREPSKARSITALRCARGVCSYWHKKNTMRERKEKTGDHADGKPT